MGGGSVLPAEQELARERAHELQGQSWQGTWDSAVQCLLFMQQKMKEDHSEHSLWLSQSFTVDPRGVVCADESTAACTPHSAASTGEGKPRLTVTRS